MIKSSRQIEFGLLIVIVALYVGIAALYAIKTPAWQVPDEPAHYNYVAQVVTNGCCPHLQVGDWNQTYLDTIKAAKFSPVALNGQLGTIRYEDHQPPLYYLLQVPVYALSNGNLIVMRLFSALMGAGVVIVAWLIVRTVFPAQPWLALATAAFVAFLPQHVAMMAGVENDSLAELIAALIMLQCVRYVTVKPGSLYSWRQPVILGVLVGVAFLTKATIYPLIVVAGLAILLGSLDNQPDFLRRLLKNMVLLLIPALLLGSILWIRNISIYGWPDFLALKIQDSVVVGQLRTGQYIADHGFTGWLRDGLFTTFDSFWGKFGWMGVPMSPGLYAALGVFSILVIIGAGIAFFRYRTAISVAQRNSLLILALAGILAFASTVYYNLSFVQFQGRYVYPGLIPIALFMAIGLAGWASLVGNRVPIIQWATVMGMMLFAVFDVYLLFRVIVPALT